ncbi:MAG: hypothetical protein E4G95_06650, partial [Bacteroidia bacterium]
MLQLSLSYIMYIEMRKYKTAGTLLILFIIVVIPGCTKEAERDFPRVNTIKPGNINKSGAILRGEIQNFRSVEIEDYGFLIGEGSMDENDDLIVFSLGSELGNEVFEGALTSGLEPGKTYYYLAYGISDGIISVGSDISFISQGSAPPVLIGYTPLAGQVADTLSIRCSNLIGLEDKYSVFFNQAVAQIIYFSDSLIRVIVPLSLELNQSTISLTAYGNEVTFTTPFTLLTPAIESFSPLEVNPGEEITIIGTDFHSTSNLNKVFIGNTPAMVSASTKNALSVVAPYTPDSLNTITVTVSGQTFTTSDKIKVKIPNGTYFEPSTGTFGDEIHIHGKNLLNFPLERVLLGGRVAEMISSSETEIIIRVPNDLSECQAEVKLVYTGITYTLDYLFFVDAPIITGFSPTEVSIGGNLIIFGGNFSPLPGNNKVIIGNTEITPLSASADQLVINIDSRVVVGSYIIGVKTCGEFTYSSETVKIKPIPWIRVADFPGGEAYKNSYFTIGEYGYVGIGTRLNHNYINGFWRYDLSNNTWTSIADFPGHTRIMAAGFSIGQDGFVGGGFDFDGPTAKPLYDYYKYLSVSNSWQKISDFPFTIPGIYAPFYEVVDQNSYVNTSSAGFYSFSDNPPLWTNQSVGYPGITSGSSSFVIGEMIYVIDYSNSVWRYDTSNGIWSEKAKFPGDARYSGIGFAIGSNGYYGLGKNGTTAYNDLWQYYPGSDTWVLTTSFPGSP